MLSSNNFRVKLKYKLTDVTDVNKCSEEVKEILSCLLSSNQLLRTLNISALENELTCKTSFKQLFVTICSKTIDKVDKNKFSLYIKLYMSNLVIEHGNATLRQMRF